MAIRDGFHTVTPYLTTHDLDDLIEFLTAGLGAVETYRATGGGGGQHVEMRIGDSMVMVGGLVSADASPATAMLHLYVEDPDASHDRAVAAGAESIMAPTDTPDGARRAGVRDRAGNMWFFGKPLAAPS